MSCDCGENSFGYVKIEDDMVVCYTGKSNDPTIHKFCNDEIVQAVKLKELLEKFYSDIEASNDVYPNNERWTGQELEDRLQELIEESKK